MGGGAAAGARRPGDGVADDDQRPRRRLGGVPEGRWARDGRTQRARGPARGGPRRRRRPRHRRTRRPARSGGGLRGRLCRPRRPGGRGRPPLRARGRLVPRLPELRRRRDSHLRRTQGLSGAATGGVQVRTRRGRRHRARVGRAVAALLGGRRRGGPLPVAGAVLGQVRPRRGRRRHGVDHLPGRGGPVDDGRGPRRGGVRPLPRWGQGRRGRGPAERRHGARTRPGLASRLRLG